MFKRKLSLKAQLVVSATKLVGIATNVKLNCINQSYGGDEKLRFSFKIGECKLDFEFVITWQFKPCKPKPSKDLAKIKR